VKLQILWPDNLVSPHFIACILLAFLQIAWPAPGAAIASDFTGPVVSVLDGDTVEVLHKGVWADPQPVLPWEWRQLRRSC